MKQAQPAPVNHLSQKETREIVTPYAFHVAPELFGTALASPAKRGIAIGVDMLLIGLLTQAASFLLAGVAAVTFFKAGNRLKQRKRFNTARLALRFMTALLLFVFALGLVQSVIDGNDASNDALNSVNGVNLSAGEAMELVALTTKYALVGQNTEQLKQQGACVEESECWSLLGQQLINELENSRLANEQASEVIEVFVDRADEQLKGTEKRQLRDELQARLDRIKPPAGAVADDVSAVSGNAVNTDKAQPPADKPASEAPPGIVAWVKSILEDLGLGFGWAAFYFSIFTAWWQGQTPGKRLCGIKVIKLDGSEPTLWESFGRYGGYGAGLATGLLGFLQVYWDPNRQAIQDKISETLVIDIRKTKVPFTLGSEAVEEEGSTNG